MSNCIGRVSAASDLRSLKIAAAGQGGEWVAEFQQQLILEVGTVASADPIEAAVRDQTGFDELKTM